MNNMQAVAVRPNAVPAGTLLLLTGALALYQLTSLVLGPQPSRQYHLSLNVPAVELEDAGSPFAYQIGAVIGEVEAAVRPAGRPSVTLTRSKARGPMPSPIIGRSAIPSGPTVAPVASAAPSIIDATPVVRLTGHGRQGGRGRERGNGEALSLD